MLRQPDTHDHKFVWSSVSVMAHVIILAFDPPKADNPNAGAVPLRALLPVDSVSGKGGQGESSLKRQLQILSKISGLTVIVLTSKARAVRESIKGRNGSATDRTFPEGVQIVETPSLSAEVLEKLIQSLDDDVPLLFIQGNVPFIEAGEIQWILEKATLTRSLLMFLVDSRLLPQGVIKKTGTFREGRFAAGSGCAITAGIARQGDFLKDIENIVRSPFAFATSFGAGFLLKFAMGRLSLKDVEVAGKEKLGIPLKILPMKSAGLALTVK